jgi:UTP-glucose-1-phosphate uridylyltransferase
MQRTLVVLAAGIGSRYGGLKQMDPVGPHGEFLLDYAVYDARRAGFSRVVFVIRRDIEAPFRSAMGARIERQISTSYVFQSLDSLPRGLTPPAGRTKPWGTGQAVLCCAATVNEPFAVINADDYYGPASYPALAAFLAATAGEPDRHAMVAFSLAKTVSEHGSVSRGICDIDSGRLRRIVETTGIESRNGCISAGAARLTGNEPVSMNCWGFKPSLFPALASAFEAFLRESGGDPKAEFHLPAVVDAMIHSGKARVDVLPTPDSWFGVTNPGDRAAVVSRIAALVGNGTYPAPLWPGSGA